MNRFDCKLMTVILAGLAIMFMLPPARGAYLESDHGDETPPRQDEPRPVVIRPIPPPLPDANVVTRLIRQVEVGTPFRYGNLTVFPLVSGRDGNGIRTLDEALKHDWIDMREEDSAQVAEVLVRNNSRHYIFLMGGEIISGGKQNRVIRQDVLLPPRSHFIGIPVCCVEKERWSDRPVEFGSRGYLAHQQLRKSAAAGEPQGAIWQEVDAHSSRAGVTSRTRDYQEIYEDKTVSKKLDECLSHFRGFCGANTVGAVAVSGNRVIACDLFSDSVLFSKLWEKICRSYAMDEIPFASPREPPFHKWYPGVDEHEIRRFLDQALRAGFSRDHTPGAGELFSINGAVTGSALVWDDEVVHAAIFPDYDIIRPMEDQRQDVRE